MAFGLGLTGRPTPWHQPPMPTFHFHIRVGGHLFEDPDGSDLPELGAARAEALAAVREAVAEQIKTGKAVGG